MKSKVLTFWSSLWSPHLSSSPYPACFAVPEAPAAPCPVQPPAGPLKTVKSAWLIIIIIGKRASCSVAMGTSDLWFCKRKQSLSTFRQRKAGGETEADWEFWTPALRIRCYFSEVSSPVPRSLSPCPALLASQPFVSYSAHTPHLVWDSLSVAFWSQWASKGPGASGCPALCLQAATLCRAW